MSAPLRVALVGLGATGVRAGAAIGRRSDAVVVAAVDTDPAKQGRALAELIDGADASVTVGGRLAGLGEVADAAVVTTTSHVAQITPLALELIEQRLHVITLCEELGYAWRSHPEESAAIDAAAKASGVCVLATGCNPGFAMDTLPLVLTAAVQGVRRIEVQRTADVTDYGPLLDKFGFGMTPEEYEAAVGTSVIGHLGFEQSIAHIADVLGWELDAIEIADPRPAAFAQEAIEGEYVSVAAGGVATVLHGGRGIVGTETVIDLRANFGFLREGDGVPRGDRYLITGRDITLDFASTAGLPSFDVTISMLVNGLVALPGIAPGLRSTSDLPVRVLASGAA